MELSFGLLACSIVAGLTLWFWRDLLRQRDVANAAAMEACTRLGLQFLDGTAAFSHWRFGREAKRWRLRRTYVFDYTAHSIERRQGFVVLLAGRVESVGFATTADDMPKPDKPNTISPTLNVTMTFAPQTATLVNAPAPDSADAPPPNQNVSSTVLDLTAWRRDHPSRGRLH
ncbi:MAG: DUF3301 domain-containing protein [Candidatus Obscuribacterales bacterium]|nr:DUF3301 domain-containing protein [Steroidobacteraceae bacterium]